MARNIAVLFASLLLAFAANAEGRVKVYGTITDNSGKPLASVMVRTMTKDTDTHWVMTGPDGSYSLEYDSIRVPFELSFSKLGYERETVCVEKRTQRLDMILAGSARALPEVTVTNPEVRLRGDTLSFLLSAFAGKGDVSLKDAMKKIPGLEVSASGEISYNGQKISNFYIEGMDLMGGKYDLATSNIPASYVDAIEILNNHKDRKIDRDLFSDKVAINVRLKSRAKFRPVGTYGVSAGWGNPLPLAASGAGMMFRNGFQTMLTLKGSDIKEFSEREGKRFLTNGESDTGNYAAEILGRLSASAPPLPRSRWVKPVDASATANFINKTGKDATLRADVGYSFIRTEYDYSDSRIYFDGDKDVIIKQAYSPLAHRHKPSISMEYENNSDDYYLKNYFSGYGEFSTDKAPVATDGGIIRQREQLSHFRFGDLLDLSWKRGKLRWDFSSSIQFKSYPDGYIDISETAYSDEGPGRYLLQQAQGDCLSVREDIAVSRTFRQMRLSIPLVINYSYSGIRTSLSYHAKKNRISEDNTEISNRIDGHTADITLSPHYEYTAPYDKFIFRAYVPVSLRLHDWRNAGSVPADNRSTRFLLAPDLYLNYKLTAKSIFWLRASYSNSAGNILDMLTAPVMTDYLSMRYRSGSLSTNRSFQTTLHYDFKLPLSFWYLNANINYLHSRRNLISRQEVREDLIEISDFPLPNNSETLSANLGISKRIKSIKTKISLGGGYSVSRNEMEQAGQLVGYRGDNLSVSATVASSPLSWMEIDYQGRVSVAYSRYLGRRESFTSQTHDIGLSFFPVDGLQLTLTSDISRKEIDEGIHKTVPLFDVKGVYSFRKFRLTCELRNLLNRQTYSYTVFNGLDRFTYEYSLRGRELILSLDFKM